MSGRVADVCCRAQENETRKYLCVRVRACASACSCVRLAFFIARPFLLLSYSVSLSLCSFSFHTTRRFINFWVDAFGMMSYEEEEDTCRYRGCPGVPLWVDAFGMMCKCVSIRNTLLSLYVHTPTHNTHTHTIVGSRRRVHKHTQSLSSVSSRKGVE